MFETKHSDIKRRLKIFSSQMLASSVRVYEGPQHNSGERIPIFDSFISIDNSKLTEGKPYQGVCCETIISQNRPRIFNRIRTHSCQNHKDHSFQKYSVRQNRQSVTRERKFKIFTNQQPNAQLQLHNNQKIQKHQQCQIITQASPIQVIQERPQQLIQSTLIIDKQIVRPLKSINLKQGTIKKQNRKQQQIISPSQFARMIKDRKKLMKNKKRKTVVKGGISDGPVAVTPYLLLEKDLQ